MSFLQLPRLRLSLAGELSAALECVCSTWGQGQAWGLVLEGHQFAWEAAVQPRLFPGNSSETVPHLLLLVETLIKSNVTLLIMKCLTYANSNKLQNNKTYNINKLSTQKDKVVSLWLLLEHKLLVTFEF